MNSLTVGAATVLGELKRKSVVALDGEVEGDTSSFTLRSGGVHLARD
jgi:hypothetical protein